MDNSLLIEKLKISRRLYNCLKQNKIDTIGELLQFSEEELCEIPALGIGCLEEVQKLKFLINTKNIQGDNFNIENISVIEFIFNEKLKGDEYILFLDSNGNYAEDVTVASLNFSNRASNCLLRNGLDSVSKIVGVKYQDFITMKQMGKTSIDEIFEKLKVICKKRKIATRKESIRWAKIILSDFSKCISEDKVFRHIVNLSDFFQNNFENFCVNTYNEETEIITLHNFENLNLITKSNFIRNLVYECIIEQVSKEYAVIEYEDLIVLFPKYISKGRIIDEIIKVLITEKVVEKKEKGIIAYRVGVKKWIKEIQNESYQKAIILRCEGKTLQEAGNVLGVTRERIRQMVEKAMLKKPLLKEDAYAYWVEKYAFITEQYTSLFSIDYTSANYLSLLYKKGKKNIYEILSDPFLYPELEKNVHQLLSKDAILYNGEYIPLKREILTREFLKANYSDNDCMFVEFMNLYYRFLKDNFLYDNEKLKFPTERAFEARVDDSQFVLAKYGRRIRYYNTMNIDINMFLQLIDIDVYKNIECSTLKLFVDNADIMSNYDIKDEYELHNLLKKKWEEIENPPFVIERMPFIIFGKANREEQVENLLFQLAPISNIDFAKAYEMEYGVKSETVLANFVECIDMYYFDGIFDIKKESIPENQIKDLKFFLVNDFYLWEDVVSFYLKRFPEGNSDVINACTMKQLGYRAYLTYIVKNNFSSAYAFFKNFFLRSDTINIDEIDSKIRNINLFYSVFADLRNSLELIEFQKNKFMKYEYFRKNVVDISKDELIDYGKIILSKVSEKYFTVKSLRNMGVITELQGVVINDYILTSSVRVNKDVRYNRIADGILFGKNTNQISRIEFFKFLLKDKEEMYLSELISFISEKYGLNFSRYNIVSVANNSDLYYDKLMDKIHLNKLDMVSSFIGDEIIDRIWSLPEYKAIIDKNKDAIIASDELLTTYYWECKYEDFLIYCSENNFFYMRDLLKCDFRNMMEESGDHIFTCHTTQNAIKIFIVWVEKFNSNIEEEIDDKDAILRMFLQ